ncbi:MAG: hypothetical protein K2P22_07750 [Lachnospiraceae bacterium]|nr:hypothetical protein [Lachnospiraceae bacterium]
MNDNRTNKTPNEALAKARDYFLEESLKPAENVPGLLTENRKIASSLAENVMSLLVCPASELLHSGFLLVMTSILSDGV